MADYQKAFNYMIRNEDANLTGEVAIDSDGGKVRLGLDSVSNPELLLGDFYTCPVAEALVQANTIYRVDYWSPILGERILNQRIASKFLDMAVNEGTKQAIRLVQRAAYGVAYGIQIDGKMGNQTLKVINDDTEAGMLCGMVQWWNWFIGIIIMEKPLDAKYEQGWRARANKLPGV